MRSIAKQVFPPSEQQQALYDFAKSANGHLIVRARAGTGKTTSIEGMVLRAPESQVLVTAFNKPIFTNLKTVFAGVPGVEAVGLNALGNRAIRNATNGNCFLENFANWDRAKQCSEAATLHFRNDRLENWLKQQDTQTNIMKIVDWAKNTIPEFKSAKEIVELATSGMIDWDADTSEEFMEIAGNVAAKTILGVIEAARSGKPFQYDFTDQLFLPVRMGWVQQKYGLVVVDESQDMSRVMLLLARRSSHGRVFVVGDDRQALYAFRGADSGALDRMKEELGAAELGLTCTYRCPKLVVERANKYVKDFYAHESAPEGEVYDNFPSNKMMEQAGPGDFILCRNNAPLMPVCLRLIAQGKRAYIQGKDVGDELVKLMKKVEKRQPFEDNEDMFARFDVWAEKERAAIEKRDLRPQVATAKLEKINDFLAIFEAMREEYDSPEEIREALLALFCKAELSKKDFIMLSSVHKAKGLEANNVFVLLDRFDQPGEDEENIRYVAVSRAQKRLYFVSNGGGQEGCRDKLPNGQGAKYKGAKTG